MKVSKFSEAQIASVLEEGKTERRSARSAGKPGYLGRRSTIGGRAIRV